MSTESDRMSKQVIEHKEDTIMKTRATRGVFGASLTLAAVLGCGAPQPSQKVSSFRAGAEGLDRTVLPIPEPERPTYSELDVRNVKTPPRFEVKPPDGAPNVVIVLIDDIGFGGPSTFGGPIRTPTLDGLAQSGLRFNNFHTTALCSPTRIALKSGRNHHTANAGSIMESSDCRPGCASVTA
jgi:arylsulfatase